MNSKRLLICSVLLNSLAVVSFTVALVLPDSVPKKIGIMLTVLFIVFLISGMVMLIVYFGKRNNEKMKNVIAAPPDRRDFEEWLKKFEPFTRAGAKLVETSERTFCKFGGLPLVPENFVWPLYGDRAIPFLLQIDFSEINADGRLNSFPKQGLLYLFVDSDEINMPSFEPGEEEYAQGRAFRILFFEKADNLAVAEKPNSLYTIYKEFCVSADIIKTYPDVDECKEAFEIYCDRPIGGMDDEYDDMQFENSDKSMVGGWATYIQGSGFTDNADSSEWILLMQIASVADDEKFMWGDNGTLYFYIRKGDLLDYRFDNIKLDMQCY